MRFKINPIIIHLWILWLLHINIVRCLYLSINSHQNSNRFQRSARCGATKFVCKSGECIDDIKLCDGHADCSDNSDETDDCATLQCINAFRCKYGACVVKNARCNKIQECFDGSDETECGLPLNGSCKVPQAPSNGEFIHFKPGDYVPNFSALVSNCKQDFKPTPPNKSFPICINGKWTSSAIECARTCTSLTNSPKGGTTYECKFQGFPLNSCRDPVHGTIATIKCQNLYESDLGNPILCSDGSWDPPAYECRAVCGEIPVQRTLNIMPGQLKKPLHPWHVGIYLNNHNKTYICGGSMIKLDMILTAAHCVTDSEGKVSPKESYLIAAGKYYSTYYDSRDKDTAQYSTIKAIYIPERYKGPIGYYEADIAVLILSKDLEISITVQPVCVDWNEEFEYQQLYEHSVGVVVGWDFSKIDEASSVELNEFTTRYVSYEQCYEKVPKDFRPFLTYDKVCAGFLNNGASVCQGDSGGGLTFPRRSNNRYYIRGVISTSPRSEDSCDPDQYATYTLISKHLQFIKNIVV